MGIVGISPFIVKDPFPTSGKVVNNLLLYLYPLDLWHCLHGNIQTVKQNKIVWKLIKIHKKKDNITKFR